MERTESRDPGEEMLKCPSIISSRHLKIIFSQMENKFGV
jgi:hypothetical protein